MHLQVIEHRTGSPLPYLHESKAEEKNFYYCLSKFDFNKVVYQKVKGYAYLTGNQKQRV